MTIDTERLLFAAGIGQLGVLIASSLVPMRLDWRNRLAELPPLLRQLFWVYGAYTVMSIIMLGLICLTCSEELASGTRLATAFCLYGAVFWGLRLALQTVLDAKPFLTTWWLRAGYHLLTCLFTAFTSIYVLALVRAFAAI
jgi:hypothetical protein